jgi:hypothetical protein
MSFAFSASSAAADCILPNNGEPTNTAVLMVLIVVLLVFPDPHRELR